VRNELPGPPGQSFRVEIDGNGQLAVLPLKNDWRHAALAILGAFALALFHTRELWEHPKLELWDIPLAGLFVLAALAVLAELVFTFFGRETIAVRDGRIVHRWSALGLRRSRTIDIATLESVVIANHMVGPGDCELSADKPVSPLGHFGKRGRIKIDAAGKSTYLDAALDENNARSLLAWLRPWLPRRSSPARNAPATARGYTSTSRCRPPACRVDPARKQRRSSPSRPCGPRLRS